MGSASANLDQRRRAYDVLAARLAALSDDHLAALFARTAAWPANVHGNQSGVINLEGAKVFVKKIALTDLERTAADEGSTANLFGLPLFYHYGIISAGFGARRELSACLKASAWALSGEHPRFPLVYHWRVLPRSAPPLPTERLQRGADYWEGSDAIRARLETISAASACVVLFIEYVPDTLRAWLKEKVTGGRLDAASEATILRFYDQWRDTAAFMNERGMLHFDLNASNVLTDGEQVYAADFGLALCADFDLSPAERDFYETHRLYDRSYVDWAFVDWFDPEAEGRGFTPALSALVDRCTPVATIFGGFLKALSGVSKTAPYPATALGLALAAQSNAR